MDSNQRPFRSRVPAASGALLSAAFGGLLCFTPSCRNDATSPGDTGVPHDTAAPVDAASDVSAVDVMTVADTLPAPDVQPDVMGVDTAAADSAPDAALDVAVIDAVVGDDIPPCDVQPDRVITYSDTATDVALDMFTANCTSLGGHIEIAPECAGRNSCAGISYDQLTDTITDHTCAGLNTCQGFSCVIP